MIFHEGLEPGIELVCNYKDNKAYRDCFHQLTNLVFGIDFEDWYQKGFWDDRYICYSLVKDNVILSNVSVSKMDLVINGSSKRAIQIGTVITHPEFRGRGLSSALIRHVLHMYEQECDIFFLFANHTAIDFYPRFNFEAAPESQFKLEFLPTSGNKNTLRKLDCSKREDLEWIKQMVLSRKPISQHFGVSNNQGLFMFYALNVFSESIYYSQEDKAIIVFQQEGQTLHLYDVVSEREVNLQNILSRISNEQTETIHFHFTPDQFIEKVEHSSLDNHEDVLFIKANFMLEKNSKFRIPVLAHA
ncbi:GNAT family N-acetyltransferase [Paenibacillus sp. Marseille-Q4541]|uniref:GNAT family N-acetyltransferase n=1 Tax=Paenibacillus sp. Marseille-Q4541 TaxID=2831522 RepID=UPI001BAC115F|nr:GNAT family N-acetyltransferase [Paenibacillus sp. Marseille-Q4541]